MATQFCRDCNNLLYPRIEGGVLQYVCNRCETTADPVDPVITVASFESKHGTNLQFNQHLMRDAALPRLLKKCQKCDSNECISYMEKSEEKALNSYYVCTKCFYEWTD